MDTNNWEIFFPWEYKSLDIVGHMPNIVLLCINMCRVPRNMYISALHQVSADSHCKLLSMMEYVGINS